MRELPDEAVDEAARAIAWVVDHDPTNDWPGFRGEARTALTAALPHIEARLREEIAADLETDEAFTAVHQSRLHNVGRAGGTIESSVDALLVIQARIRAGVPDTNKETDRCNHLLGSSGSMSVVCCLEKGHDGEHRSIFHSDTNKET